MKKFRFICWIVAILYLLPSVVLFLVSGKLMHRTLFVFLSSIWFLIAIVLIKLTNKKIWLTVLPLEQEHATLLFKSTLKESLYDGSGGSSDFHHNYLIFELSNGIRKVFNLTNSDFFFTLIPGDTGIVRFKEYKNKLFFIDFKQEKHYELSELKIIDSTTKEKYSNWRGWILCCLYFFVFVFLVFLSVLACISNDKSIKIKVILSIICLIACLYLMPLTLNRTWYKVLPLKKCHAKLIFLSTNEKMYLNQGFAPSPYKYIVFELPSGERKHFNIGDIVFSNELLNCQGTLTYKEYKRRSYFIDFKKQSLS